MAMETVVMADDYRKPPRSPRMRGYRFEQPRDARVKRSGEHYT
ncbi:MAG TPA: hypothetical protein VI339_00110 [Steroidobacteraceae bacterium]|nr:hypothetical protein [Steroidobacteraceae bacterium]